MDALSKQGHTTVLTESHSYRAQSDWIGGGQTGQASPTHLTAHLPSGAIQWVRHSLRSERGGLTL